MAVHDIYSKRKKRLAGGAPDVYSYDVIPKALRNQLVYILSDLLGSYSGAAIAKLFIYTDIATILAREWGVVRLVDSAGLMGYDQEVIKAIREVEDPDHVLDIIELAVQLVWEKLDDDGLGKGQKKIDKFDLCIEELNFRFRESAVGYECSNRQMIRIDSQFIHSEVVKPAIFLLGTPGFEGAHDEFLTAHEHFRHKRYKEALNEALKSLESTIKVIVERRGWETKGDTANKLIRVCMENGLFPSYYESHLSALTNLILGVASVRNNEAGHGQGASVKEIDPHNVAYTLHMTASAIVLFVQSYQALPEAPNELN